MISIILLRLPSLCWDYIEIYGERLYSVCFACSWPWKIWYVCRLCIYIYIFDYSNSTHKNDNTLSDRLFNSGWSSCCNFYRRISNESSGHSTTVVNISTTTQISEGSSNLAQVYITATRKTENNNSERVFRERRRVYQQRDLTNRWSVRKDNGRLYCVWQWNRCYWRVSTHSAETA